MVADPRVAVVVVVLVEKRLAERPCVGDRAEALGEARAVLEGLELRLAVGVVIAHVRPGVRPLDPQEVEQLGYLV